MKTIKNTRIIGIDHGYGNMKTANRIRRPKSPEDENRNKERRKEISKQMKPVRERLRRAEKILEKSPHLYELLKQEHELEKKARARYLDRSR